jgi:hypothetical protein
VDDDHRALFPRLAGFLVADAAPEIDDPLAAAIDAAGAAQLVPMGEVVGKRLSHRLKAACHEPLDGHAGQHNW